MPWWLLFVFFFLVNIWFNSTQCGDHHWSLQGFSSQVLVLSLVFMAIVCSLHILGKFRSGWGELLEGFFVELFSEVFYKSRKDHPGLVRRVTTAWQSHQEESRGMWIWLKFGAWLPETAMLIWYNIYCIYIECGPVWQTIWWAAHL